MPFVPGLIMVATREDAEGNPTPPLKKVQILAGLWVFTKMWGEPTANPPWKPLRCSVYAIAKGCGLEAKKATAAREALHALVELGYLNQRAALTLNTRLHERSEWEPGPLLGGVGGTSGNEVGVPRQMGWGTSPNEVRESYIKQGENKDPSRYQTAASDGSGRPSPARPTGGRAAQGKGGTEDPQSGLAERRGGDEARLLGASIGVALNGPLGAALRAAAPHRPNRPVVNYTATTPEEEP